MKEKTTKKIVASVVILLLLAFLVYAFLPYMSAFFGAAILFVLFNPLYTWLTRKKLRPSFAASIVITISILIILIPVFLILSLVIAELPTTIESAKGMVTEIQNLSDLLPGINLSQIIRENITRVGTFLQDMLFDAVSGITTAIISLVIMYFLLFYMFVRSKDLHNALMVVSPFNVNNTKKLVDEATNMTYSVVISTGMIGALQGVLLAVGFVVFGIPGAVLWGIIGTILAFIPVIGIPIVWIPAGIIQLSLGNTVAGVGILIWGAVLSNVDNFIRPYIQKRVGRIHPLITLLGVFIGIPFFGIVGVIIGPLLLSYFFLAIHMFREEYWRE